MDPPFLNRKDAGRQLAERLKSDRLLPDTLVVGLPRGGVVVAHQVAELLNLPMDVLIVRKLGVPGQKELAMGAVVSGGAIVINDELIAKLRLVPEDVDRVVAEELRELDRRERLYRGDAPPLDIRGRRVVIIDDGLATGATMLAAVTVLRQKEPRHLMIAIPIAGADTCTMLEAHVDELVCLVTPQAYFAVGSGYGDFSQTSDDEVLSLLRRRARM